jgi:hypothetical protein
MTWRPTTALPAAAYGHAVTQAGGYLYIMGGFDGAITDDVYRAPINADGTLGAFLSSTPLTTVRQRGKALTVRRAADATDYILHIGGHDGVNALASVLWTTQGTDGTLNSWTAGASMLADRHGPAVFAIGEYVFVAGGSDSAGVALASVEWNTIARILSGSAWQALTALPEARERVDGARDGRVLYVAGGHLSGANKSTVYRGIVSFVSGTPSVSWDATTALPVTVARHSCLAYDHSLYVVGGDKSTTGSPDTDSDDIYRAPLLADGNVGDWQKVSSLSGGNPSYRAALMTGTPADTMLLLGGHDDADARTVNAWTESPATFWRLAERGAAGIVRKLHVYIDGVLTYRYADQWFEDGTEHEVILSAISNIQRGLGTDRFPQAADVDVILDNTTGAADWFVNQATAVNWLTATVRLYVGAYESTATDYPSGTYAWHPLGEYYVTEPPQRDATQVRFGLTEDTRGVLVDMLRTPTVREWRDAGGAPWTTTQATQIRESVLDSSMPLLFGREVVFGAPILVNESEGKICCVICVSRSSAPQTVLELTIATSLDSPPPTVLPQTDSTFGTLWTASVSPGFVKDGVTWYVHWVDVLYAARKYLVPLWENSGTFKVPGPDGDVWIFESPPSGHRGGIRPPPVIKARSLLRFWVSSTPGSSTASTNVTGKTSPESVLRDLVGTYSRAGDAYLDEDALERFESQLHRNAYCSGSLAGGDGANVRDAVAKLLSSWDFDAFADYRGRLSVTGLAKDYRSQTGDLVGLYEVYEEDIRDFSDRHPARGQRWALFNRVYLEDAKMSGPEMLSPHEGPWDNPNTPLGTSRFIDARLSVAWRSMEDSESPWSRRGLNTTARPVVRFTTHLGILKLDLGAFFLLSWTRNLGGPYTSDLFKLEELDIDIVNCEVTVTAVWVGDTAEPFLLDAKSYLTRVESTAVGGPNGTATVTDSSATVNFSLAGVLTTAAVVAGDHLILRDVNIESAFATKRSRALKIASVVDGDTLTVTDPDLDFGSGGIGVAVSFWEIRRSHLTAPALSFPNYPDGSAVYGKIASGTTYSDSAVAHVLTESD